MAYEGFQSPNRIDWQGGAGWGIANFASGKKPLVQFYRRPTLNPLKSSEAGTPIHDTNVFIKIQHPGETLQTIDREMNAVDRASYAQEWAAFMENREQIPDGTPIYYLFPDHPDIAENLKSMGVHTVEQLSSLSAHGMDRIGMGAQDYVNAANAYLDAARQGATYHKMRVELESRDRQIEVLSRQIAEQKRQLDALIQQLEGPGEYVRLPAHMAQGYAAPVAAAPAAPKDHMALPANLKRTARPAKKEADAAA